MLEMQAPADQLTYPKAYTSAHKQNNTLVLHLLQGWCMPGQNVHLLVCLENISILNNQVVALILELSGKDLAGQGVSKQKLTVILERQHRHPADLAGRQGRQLLVEREPGADTPGTEQSPHQNEKNSIFSRHAFYVKLQIKNH